MLMHFILNENALLFPARDLEELYKLPSGERGVAPKAMHIWVLFSLA